MNREDLSYAAGFIDGEGYIGILRRWYESKRHGRYATYTSCLSVTNTDLASLSWLKGLFATGEVYPEGRKSKPTPNSKKRYLWIVTGPRAARVVSLLLPFVRGKKRQAELLLQFQGTVDKTQSHARQRGLASVRERLYIECKSYHAYCGQRG